MYKELTDAKKSIDSLIFELKYFKDYQRKAKKMELINTFISLVNLTERLADGGIDRQMMDVILLNCFKDKYNTLQNDGIDGFIGASEINLFRKKIGFDFKIGPELMMESVADQMAIDTVANLKTLTEDEKIMDITKSPKLMLLVNECKIHWMSQLNKFLNYCYSSANYGIIKNR